MEQRLATVVGAAGGEDEVWWSFGGELLLVLPQMIMSPDDEFDCASGSLSTEHARSIFNTCGGSGVRIRRSAPLAGFDQYS